jgi:hypothetical protein
LSDGGQLAVADKTSEFPWPTLHHIIIPSAQSSIICR